MSVSGYASRKRWRAPNKEDARYEESVQLENTLRAKEHVSVCAYCRQRFSPKVNA